MVKSETAIKISSREEPSYLLRDDDPEQVHPSSGILTIPHRLSPDLADRTNAVYPATIIAGRGYESYNVFTHIQGKG